MFYPQVKYLLVRVDFFIPVVYFLSNLIIYSTYCFKQESFRHYHQNLQLFATNGPFLLKLVSISRWPCLTPPPAPLCNVSVSVLFISLLLCTSKCSTVTVEIVKFVNAC